MEFHVIHQRLLSELQLIKGVIEKEKHHADPFIGFYSG